MAYALMFLASVSLFVSVQSQCVPIATTGVSADAMPNIFKITDLSYQLTVEANLKEQKKTLYADEFYDLEFARGRVDTTFEGELKSFLYFNETKETFTFYNTTCESNLMSGTPKIPHNDAGMYGWSNSDPKQPIYGPSNLLRDGYAGFIKKTVGKETKQERVRGVLTNVWQQCLNENKLTIRYFFMDGNTESGFQANHRPVPARITVKGTTPQKKDIDHTYDFVNYQTFISAGSKAFNIPVTVGCTRLVGELKRIPVYAQKDFYLEAEIVYTPYQEENIHSYVSNIEITVDAKSGHIAYRTAPWKAHQDAKFTEPGKPLRNVYDIKNGFLYSIDESEDSCLIEDMATNKPTIDFPDGTKLNLLNSDIFITENSTAKEFQYLGETTEREIPASVYEKKIENDETLGTIIITRYHIADNVYLNTENPEEHAPLKVIYWDLGLDEDEFFGVAVFNFYSYSSHPREKAAKFDVTSCFQADDQSKWFQITFPMRDNKPEEIVPLIPFVQNHFLDSVVSVPLAPSPLRIPKIIVDVDVDNLYVTGLLLERPDFLIDFSPRSSTGIKGQSLGITTEKGCAKRCLERDSCVAFSYCGALCVLADKDPIAEGNTINNKDCRLYLHDKIHTSLPTLQELTTSIASSVEFGSVQIQLPGKADDVKPRLLLASSYRDGMAFGIDGVDFLQDDYIEDSFELTASGFALTEDTKLTTNLGQIPYATCRQICRNRPGCESLSYCLASSQCIISSMHGSISEGHRSENTQCVILTRKYLDSFERFPGFVLTTNAADELDINSEDLCAKACKEMRKFKCLSFDYCPNAVSKKSCLLHKTHTMSKTEDVKVDNKEYCGHFSKKFVYDYDSKPSNIEGSPRTIISGITAEQCAQYCTDEGRFKCLTFESCHQGNLTKGYTCKLFDKPITQLGTKDSSVCEAYSLPSDQKL